MATNQWKTPLGVALAAAGSAIGLGNFLRFPGVAYNNGGGAFIVPYLICFFLIAIPLSLVEWALGKKAGQLNQHSPAGVLSVFIKNRFFLAVAGAFSTIIPIGIYFFYALIQSWCLSYMLVFLGLSPYEIPKTSQESIMLFEQISKSSHNGFSMSFPLLSLTVVAIANAWIILKGLQHGIERFCKFAVPLMIALALILLTRVLTIGSVEGRTVSDALGFMWNPKGASENWGDYLLNSSVWLAAFGQVFFSLGTGCGVIVVYASYVPKNKDVALTGLTAASANGFVEVCLAGLITIPAIFLFLGPDLEATSSFSLGFMSLPLVFEKMWGLNRFFGFLWFLLLFLAAITSSISIIQSFVAFLQDYFSLPFKKAALFAIVIMTAGNVLCYTLSLNNGLLASLDFWLGTITITLSSLTLCLLGAMINTTTLHQMISENAAIKIPRLLISGIKFISLPIFLILMLVWFKSGISEQLTKTFDSFEQIVGFFVSIGLFVFTSIIIFKKSK